MLATPFIIERSEHIVRDVSRADWMARAMELHNAAVQSMAVNQRVVVCGYGRSGQNLARLLDTEGVGFIALDVDPKRVKEAAAAGEHVVYGDAARREVLIAAGLLRARALVVTIADSALALRILSQVRELRSGLPVVVRMLDDLEIERLKDAGATAVLAEIMEGSLMLASHTLVLLGVPLNRVLRRIRDTREQRYSLLRGFFHGASDAAEDVQADPRLLHSVLVTPGAAAIGKTLAELDFAGCGVEIKAVRRPGITAQAPQPDARIDSGDVLVLYGAEHDCAAAEIRMMQG
jgi:CPA2 family monovalent cation:H+ antiporter-2